MPARSVAVLRAIVGKHAVARSSPAGGAAARPTPSPSHVDLHVGGHRGPGETVGLGLDDAGFRSVVDVLVGMEASVRGPAGHLWRVAGEALLLVGKEVRRGKGL